MNLHKIASRYAIACLFITWSIAGHGQDSDVDQIESMVLEFYGGEVLRTELESYAGSSVYKVKLLGSDNSIQIIRVDADTGEIID